MATPPRPSDAIVLHVRDRIATTDDPRRHRLFHFTAFGQNQPPATLLHGFSFGAELGGLPPVADEGLDLSGDAELAGNPALGDPDLRGPRYRLHIDHYLERLRREKVNTIKVSVFDERPGRHSPYATDADGAPIGDGVTGISAAYLARLEELVRKARDRGIVVVLALWSSRMLREPGWSASPFNARNNNTGDGQGAGAFIAGSPLQRFCVVRPPPAGRRFDMMSVAEKLYVVQRELVTALATTVHRYWNVVFEICDDPRGPGDPAEMLEVIPWHVTVAIWLADLLHDRRGRRRRCLAVNGSARLRGALLDALGAREDGDGAPLVDLVTLPGGAWGGYPGQSSDEAAALRAAATPGRDLFAPGAITGGVTHREVAWDGIDGALGALDRRRVVAVLDTDGHHLAQKLPRPYLEAARSRRAHFAYRWPPVSLHRVDVAHESYDELGKQGQICPARGRAGRGECVTFGLDQRLEQLTAADGPLPVTGFPLPPPAAPPRLLGAVLADDVIELTFQPPPVAPEGYALFVGDTPDSVWEGTDLFPDPLPVELGGGGGRVRLPVVTQPATLFVALAATRGVLTSDLSEPVGPLVLTPTGSRLVAADVPDEVETRRELRGHLSFVNTSNETWRGPETGVLLQAAELEGGLAQLFFPMTTANLQSGPAEVAPGQTVTVHLNQMILEGAFAEASGAVVPPILPYSRRPIRLRAGIARRQEAVDPDAERPRVTFTPIGEFRDALPDGRPLTVRVRQPRRLATRYVPETQTPVRKGFVLPLADGIDRGLHLASMTAKEGTPGTILRANIALERLVKAAGQATRVLQVTHDHSETVPINVEIVRLHPLDVYFGLPPLPPRHRVLGLGAGATERIPLVGFTGGFTLTVAISAAAFPGGTVATWTTQAATTDGGPEHVEVRNATAAAADVVMYTAELVEDGEPGDGRLSAGSIVAAPGSGPQYVSVSDGQTHRYVTFRLVADKPVAVQGQVVLRAGADRVFRRELEITVAAFAEPVTVTWQVLEIPVDASNAVNRDPAALHPAVAARVLAFFNGVSDVTEIVSTIRDNRAFHRDTRRAYAVRPKLAVTILATRKKLPGGRFETVDQIAKIAGVGLDTFEDIAATFQDDGTPPSRPG